MRKALPRLQPSLSSLLAEGVLMLSDIGRQQKLAIDRAPRQIPRSMVVDGGGAATRTHPHVANPPPFYQNNE